MSNQIRDKVIFYGDKKDFEPKVVEINGELYQQMPTYYKRTTQNEVGGITTEYSLTPFKNETTEKGYPR